MRAFLINAYNQTMQEIDLAAESGTYYQQVQQHLNTEKPDSIHPNQLFTVLFDPLAFTKTGIPAFLLGLMDYFPLFGTVICVGRNPITYQMADLSEEYTLENFEVIWYSPTDSEECRKKSMEIGINNYKS